MHRLLTPLVPILAASVASAQLTPMTRTQALQTALASLNLGATCRVEKTKRKGIAASKFTVEHEEQKKLA